MNEKDLETIKARFAELFVNAEDQDKTADYSYAIEDAPDEAVRDCGGVPCKYLWFEIEPGQSFSETIFDELSADVYDRDSLPSVDGVTVMTHGKNILGIGLSYHND